MAHEPPNTHLGIAAVATAVGGGMMLVLFAIAVSPIWSFVFLLPWLLGAIGLYHGVRAAMLPKESTRDIEDRGKRALHFSIFSLSVSGMFVVLLLLAILMAARG